ncbi:PQQ-binding-like beta-propeller repeat protein [Chloroflexota bacterium]
MGSVPDSESWIICPICHKANPPETRLCQHCWGAGLRSGKLVPFDRLDEETKRILTRLKLKKRLERLAVSLTSFLLTSAVVFGILYLFTDIVFYPPPGLNSNSSHGDWAMFGHDLGHSNTADSGGTLPQGKTKWVFSTDAAIHSSPVVANGTIYFGSRDSKVYSVDAETGEKLWEFGTGSWVESSPAVVNGIVYIGTNDGNLYALDARSGEKLWNYETPHPIMSSPAVADGIIYFGDGDYNIYALDAATGAEIWDFDAGASVISSPVVANGIVYIGTGGEYFYALHALSGRLRLHYKSFYSVYSSPAVSGTTVYFTDTRGFLIAIDGDARNWPTEHETRPFWFQFWVFGLPIPSPPPQSGFLWGLRLGITTTSSPAIANNTLYTGADNKLVAVDLERQSHLWEFPTGDRIRSSPAVAGNTVYIGSTDGSLYAVDATTGEKRWSIPTGGMITSSPAVANGVVYISSHDGKLYAIE